MWFVALVLCRADRALLIQGIDMTLYEREKQHANFIIYSFYLSAVNKVAAVTRDFHMVCMPRVCALSCGGVVVVARTAHGAAARRWRTRGTT